ncbi:hypothetical protein [Romboutsia ilealis]|uniref:hypothetical protein n=1 Tax=Romboutsia ilealis TaxID=1115758 RepID=UPI002729BD29|nr:hypothetical protein [Romboutsia ilealis]
MIKRVKGSIITDDFLESFGKLYHAFKSFGLCPGDITTIFMCLLDVTDSTIRRYVRKARVLGYITDTYEENRQEMLNRQKGVKLGDEAIKGFIFDQLNKKETKKPLNKTK